MASACPCGCGRSVRFNAHCMAKRAVYISSLLIVAVRMRDRADREVEREEWSRFLHLGEYYRNTYLGVAHGDDLTLSDSPAAFAEFRRAADGWEARALSISRRLWVEDEKWRATWDGPSYQVPTVVPDVAAPSGAAPAQAVQHADGGDDRTVGWPALAVPAAMAQTTVVEASPHAGARISEAIEPGSIRPSADVDVPSDSLTRPDRWALVPGRQRSVSESAELPTDQTCAVATCIFCARPAGPVEYAWPEWLCRHFAERLAAGNIDRGADDLFVARMRSEVDQTIDCVCPTCVHGWIQNLDDEVLAFLPKMIEGNETRLSPRKQGLLARWAARTAVIMEYADDGPPQIPRAASQVLRRVGVHAGTQVLLGRYDGHVRLLTHDRDVFRRTVDDVECCVPQATFVIGNVFLQVLTDPWRDNSPSPIENTSRMLTPLVPVHHRKIDWPPPESIDDSLYDGVRYGTT